MSVSTGNRRLWVLPRITDGIGLVRQHRALKAAPLKAVKVRQEMPEQSSAAEPSLALLSDEVLMTRTGTGDRLAYAQLVDRHLASFTGLAVRLTGHQNDGEELIQEAFLRLWKYAPKWAEDGAKFTTWFYRVVMNLSIDHQRKTGKWRNTVSVDASRGDDGAAQAVMEIAESAEAADDNMQRQEQAAEIQQALAALPERQKEAIVLCYFQELSNREAAEVMEINIKALESLLTRGRKGLQKQLRHLKSEAT